MMDDARDGLSWPVRRSFLQYLATVAGGEAVLARGASVDPARGVMFPLARAEVAKDGASGTIWCGGEVRFRGHMGMLQIDLGDPRIDLSDRDGLLSVVGGERGIVALATFLGEVVTHDGFVLWLGRQLRLTPEGAALFGGVYEPESSMDDLVVTIPMHSTSNPRLIA